MRGYTSAATRTGEIFSCALQIFSCNQPLNRSYNVTGAPLSYIMENDVTVSALTEVIRHCSNVEVKYNTKVKRWVQLVTSLNIIFIIQDISF